MYVLLQRQKTEKNNREKRNAIKFSVTLQKGATYTYEMIQEAFGNDSLLHVQAFR
jgi:hypothetical protein